ncbi:MAG: SPOR domain-containing protein [Pseudomonadota bacterium]
MKYLTVVAAAAIAATGWTTDVDAQTSPKAVPAEFPPASFTGRQYVDSTGCVFIRAGIDNDVSWVPRLTRGRQQVCGFQPSLSASAIAQVNALRAAAPEPATTTAAATPAPAPAPAPAPRVVRAPATPAPAAKPATAAPAPAAAPAKPKAKPKPAPVATTTARAKVPSACSGRSALAQQFLSSRRGAVRCGPQTQPHVTIKDGPPSPDATVYTFQGHPRATTHGHATSSGQVRVAPKHVYEEQLASTEGVSVPEGFEVVWDDDRLNPKRAHQTFAGKAQMEQIWTKRVPRTLKPAAVSAGSHVSYAAGGVSDAAKPEVSRAATVPSAAALAEDTRRASHRYVQVGAFSDQAGAQRAAQRLANSGLPTKLGKHRQGAQTYTLVVVGPYKTQGALDGGLARVRGMGYAGATLKR